MKTATRRLILGSVGLVAVLGLGGCAYISSLLFKPRPIKAADPVAWAQLRLGMTKPEVAKLLGKSASIGGPATIEACGKKITTPEFWEYNWTDGLPIFSPSDKAYAVYFDPAGRVLAFREPKPADSNVPPAKITGPVPAENVVAQLMHELHAHPQQADLIILAKVRVEAQRVDYVISEIWKGDRYLGLSARAGNVLYSEPREPDTIYGRLALACYYAKPGSTNILPDHGCRYVYTVEAGRISTDFQGGQTVSLRRLRQQIKELAGQ